MTAIVMAASGLTVPFVTGGLDTTMSVVGSQIYVSDSAEDWRLYGFDNGVDFGNASSMGTLDEDTYNDGGSNSRTITALYWAENGAPSSITDDLFLCMSVINVPDTDTTFISLEYNGQTYTRTSRTNYYATTNSATTWRWDNISPNGPTGGTPAVVINV